MGRVGVEEDDERETDRPPPLSPQDLDVEPLSARAPRRAPRRRDDGARARHAADPIYERLAVAILEGSIAPGAALPPERELAERFGVSRLIVRQAVHRLADVGLVRVRQGGPSLVVHPNDAKDLRIIDLVYRLGPKGSRELREVIERQFLHGHALLYLASKRASRERIAAIATMAEDYAERGAPVAEMAVFEKKFFEALADGTDNRFYMLETGWWFRMLEQRGGGGNRPPIFSDDQRAAFYREIARRLREDKDAARHYLETLGPIFEMIGTFLLGG